MFNNEYLFFSHVVQIRKFTVLTKILIILRQTDAIGYITTSFEFINI